jgi:serine/threonine protein kinase
MALDHLHSRTEPIVHRDVKHSNLVLCGADRQSVKLIDFGMAQQVPCNVAGCNIADLDGDCDIKGDDFRQSTWKMDRKHQNLPLHGARSMTPETGPHRTGFHPKILCSTVL